MKIKIDSKQRAYMLACNIAGKVTDEDGVLDINQLVICVEELLDEHAKEYEELLAKKERVEKMYEDLNTYVERHYEEYR